MTLLGESSSANGAFELELVREECSSRSYARVSESDFSAIEVLPDRRTVVLHLKRRITLGNLLAHALHNSTPRPLMLCGLAMVPTAMVGGARGALAALRWWLPHVTVHLPSHILEASPAGPLSSG